MNDGKGQDLTIFSIATNGYVEYWLNMVKSFLKVHSDQAYKIKFVLFTNEISVAERLELDASHILLETVEISNLGWPEATLFRYEIMETVSGKTDSDLCMYLDSDMLILSSLSSLIQDRLQSEKLGLISHPGYFRPQKYEKFNLYFRHPFMLFKDLKILFMQGSLGTWETNDNNAFVSRKYRVNYICGGIWIGKREKFFQLCSQLSKLTREDYNSGKTPVWFDESYLNWWASFNDYDLLGPGYCFDPTYPQLSRIKPIVEAVRKPRPKK
jgi:hypothetical protein